MSLSVEPEEGIQLLNGLSSVKVIPKNGKNHSNNSMPLTLKNKGTSTDRNIKLLWRNVSYTIVGRSYSWKTLKLKPQYKFISILNNLNGTIESGKLTAIIGPSGAGKTTLLECLSGQRQKDVSGQIMVNKFGDYNDKNIKIAYNPQHDYLMRSLTVKETLLFASKLKNLNKNDRSSINFSVDGNFNVDTVKGNDNYDYHHRIVVTVIQRLGLEQCSSVRVSNCSGGQLKRLGIGLELISSPSILLLDEPTSGLDSVSCLQCITLLKQLSKNTNHPMIIAASIHQPTARILSYFDHLYVLSNNGQCIYNGPTQQLLSYLSNFDIHCPQYHNPADFITEIACGDHGKDLIDKLANHIVANNGIVANGGIVTNGDIVSHDIPDGSIKISRIFRKSRKHLKGHQLSVTWTLLQRCWITSIREPILSWLRVFATILLILMIAVLYMKNSVGAFNGCVERPTMEMIETLKMQKIPSQNNRPTIGANVGFLFFSIIYIAIASTMPTIITFPIELSVLLKESSNGWYTIGPYYMAKSLTDIPLLLSFPAVYCYFAYQITSQIDESWRLLYFMLIFELLALVSQSVGLLMSAFYINKMIAAVFAGSLIQIPLILFTGVFVRIVSITEWVQPLTYISYFRVTYESLIVALYGFDRCPPIEEISIKHMKQEFGDDLIPFMNCLDEQDPDILINATITLREYNEQLKSNGNSYIMNVLQLNDYDLYLNIGILIAYIVAIRFAGYLVLLWKTNRGR